MSDPKIQHGFAIIDVPGQALPSTLAVLADSLDEVIPIQAHPKP